MSVLLILSALGLKTHASFSREVTRSIVHRYRPICHFPDSDQDNGFINRQDARRYTSAIVVLSATKDAYGMVQQDDDRQTVYIFNSVTSDTDDVLYSPASPARGVTLRAVLSTGAPETWDESVSAAVQWHAAYFPVCAIYINKVLQHTLGLDGECEF